MLCFIKRLPAFDKVLMSVAILAQAGKRRGLVNCRLVSQQPRTTYRIATAAPFQHFFSQLAPMDDWGMPGPPAAAARPGFGSLSGQQMHPTQSPPVSLPWRGQSPHRGNGKGAAGQSASLQPPRTWNQTFPALSQPWTCGVCHTQFDNNNHCQY